MGKPDLRREPMKRRLLKAGRAISVLAILAVFADAATAQQGRRFREEEARENRAPKIGDAAPLFKLKPAFPK